jgi:L-fuconolactonase
MLVVDAHCHASELFFEPIELLVYQMERNNVQHAVLIQIRGQYDNSYHEDCIRRHPGKFCSVVIVNTQLRDCPDRLSEWAERGAVGVRLRANDGEAIWRRASELGIAVSTQGSANEFASEQFVRLVEQFPDIPIVLEHYGGLLSLGGRFPSEEVVTKVLQLARYPNLYIKIHGLGEFSERALPMTPDFPFVRPIPDVLDRVSAVFGATNMMWGSDYPPSSMREGFRNALRLPLASLEKKYRQEDLEKIFGRNALKVFPIRG